MGLPEGHNFRSAAAHGLVNDKSSTEGIAFAETLTGGKRRRRRSASRSRKASRSRSASRSRGASRAASRSRSASRARARSGGMGYGALLKEAIVPFGLFAMQKKRQKRRK